MEERTVVQSYAPLIFVVATTDDELENEGQLAAHTARTEGEQLLRKAFDDVVPVVAVLGQSCGFMGSGLDHALTLALEKAGRSGASWKALLSRDPLPEALYPWLGERLLLDAPSSELLSIADAPFSAVFTSSINPGLVNLFATSGREPEPVLLGDPPPPALRSRRRPPIYYLFGRASAGAVEFQPPSTSHALSQRRLRHASAMLRIIPETATPLGLVIVDGYRPSSDWLRAEDLLAVLDGAPRSSVLWCGPEPEFEDEDREVYESLLSQEVIVREERSLGVLLAALRASGVDAGAEHWDDPETVTLTDNRRLVTTARLRLSTQASSTIIDDSWTGFLEPLSPAMELAAFQTFHAVPSGVRGLIDGVRRSFAVTRDFELYFKRRVMKALAHHHLEKGAIVLHGQSGVGKSVALGRLAFEVRASKEAAVLFAFGRIPQASDVVGFMSEVDQLGAVTLLIVDAVAPYQRYDDLLAALRSRGHRVVVVGTSYKIEQSAIAVASRFIEAPASLSPGECSKLDQLARRYFPDHRDVSSQDQNALARFYWNLPISRGRLSEGLGKEARSTEANLRIKGAKERGVAELGGLGLALVEAGYARPKKSLLGDAARPGPDSDTAAGRVIDYIMASSRLYKWVPVNLVLRSVLSQGLAPNSSLDVALIRDLFEGQDLFRWRFADGDSEELLVGARLQIEAELICNLRMGGATGEASRIIELISNAIRAGLDSNEETRFVADIVYALGPDGPFKDRYKDAYASIARALSELRERRNVVNARLMLQEATLRRHYIRTHQAHLDADEKNKILDEARRAVDEALQKLGQATGKRLYASKRTRDNLWVERAATYGFLATDSAIRGGTAEEVWANYRAARDAVRMATGQVDTYHPLDIALWLPAKILREARDLIDLHKIEMEADIRSTLQDVDAEALDAKQFEIFQRQRASLGDVLKDNELSDDAFAALSAAGSSAGYFLRARAFAPQRPDTGSDATDQERARARSAAEYLRTHYARVASDPRCLLLLLSCEWVSLTGKWMFRGQRQPLPACEGDRKFIRSVLTDLAASSASGIAPKYRYLEAVLRWLVDDEAGALAVFRALSAETEYVDQSRVVTRHVIADEGGTPIVFEGVVDRQIGDKRWSMFVPAIFRHVDIVETDFGPNEVAIGRTLREINVGFNYLGPIANLRRR